MNDFNSIVDWLNSGAALTSPVAPIAVGLVVSRWGMPLLASIFNRFKWEFGGDRKLAAVFALGAILTATLKLSTHSDFSWASTIVLGGSSALTAVGVYEASRQIQKTKEDTELVPAE